MRPASEYADWLERNPTAVKREELIRAIIEARNEAIDAAITITTKRSPINAEVEIIEALTLLQQLKEQNK